MCAKSPRKYSMNIDFDAYKAYRNTRRRQSIAPNGVTATPSPAAEPASGILPAPSSNPSEPPTPYPTSFAHIVELVSTGQPIPGIKDIPSTVLVGQGTQPVQTRRKKPWETDAGSAPVQGDSEATST
jgi:hypothetical protein